MRRQGFRGQCDTAVSVPGYNSTSIEKLCIHSTCPVFLTVLRWKQQLFLIQITEIQKGKTEMIIINKKQDGEKLTVQMAGRLDTQTAPQLEAELKEGLDGVKELVFDLKEV